MWYLSILFSLIGAATQAELRATDGKAPREESGDRATAGSLRSCPRLEALSHSDPQWPLSVACLHGTRSTTGTLGKIWLLRARSDPNGNNPARIHLLQNRPDPSYRHLDYSGQEFPTRWEATVPPASTSPGHVVGINGNFFGSQHPLGLWQIGEGRWNAIRPPRPDRTPYAREFVFLGPAGEWLRLQRWLKTDASGQLRYCTRAATPPARCSTTLTVPASVRPWLERESVGLELHMPLLQSAHPELPRADYDCTDVAPTSATYRLRGCVPRARTVLCLEGDRDSGTAYTWMLGVGRIHEIATQLARQGANATSLPRCRHAYNLDGGGSSQLFVGKRVDAAEGNSHYEWFTLFGSVPPEGVSVPLPATHAPYYTRPVEHWVGWGK